MLYITILQSFFNEVGLVNNESKDNQRLYPGFQTTSAGRLQAARMEPATQRNYFKK
jgi:hypothetical protein